VASATNPKLEEKNEGVIFILSNSLQVVASLEACQNEAGACSSDCSSRRSQDAETASSVIFLGRTENEKKDLLDSF
jgi:hypothetical protein